MTQTKTFPAVRAFAHDRNWITYVRSTTVYGRVIVLDEFGYEMRLPAKSVVDAGYEISVAIADGKLVVTPVAA